MSTQHKTLADGRWLGLSLVEQLANVGSEVERALNWRAKNNLVYCRLALGRAPELLDLTVRDPRHRKRLKELTRLREVLLDYFWCDNSFKSSQRSWRSYFYAFPRAARAKT